MKKFFQHLRRQPKSVRDNYALGFSAVFTLAVFLVWLVAFPGFNATSSAVAVEAESKQRPFATFLKQSKEQLGSLISAFGDSEEKKPEVDQAEPKASGGIILTDEDRQIVEKKEQENKPETATTSEPSYSEVLIGTTTASGSAESEASAGGGR